MADPRRWHNSVYPLSMAELDRAGNLFVGDSSCGPPGYGPAGFGNRIRRVSPDGIITTVAGNGKAGASGDGGLATGAELAYPTSIAADDEGNLFIAQQKWVSGRSLRMGSLLLFWIRARRVQNASRRCPGWLTHTASLTP